MNMIQRKEAKALGLTRYFTNKPCKHNHIAERYVQDGSCSMCKNIAYKTYSEHNLESEQSRKKQWMQSFRDSLEDKTEFNKKHYESYKAQYKARARIRQDGCKQATPKWVDLVVIYEIYKNCPPGYHVDHIVALKGVTYDNRRVCGLHVPWNLQYLPASVNIRKSNKVSRDDLNEVI